MRGKRVIWRKVFGLHCEYLCDGVGVCKTGCVTVIGQTRERGGTLGVSCN